MLRSFLFSLLCASPFASYSAEMLRPHFSKSIAPNATTPTRKREPDLTGLKPTSTIPKSSRAGESIDRVHQAKCHEEQERAPAETAALTDLARTSSS